MPEYTGGILNLAKPLMSDLVEMTIPQLAKNMQDIDDIVTIIDGQEAIRERNEQDRIAADIGREQRTNTAIQNADTKATAAQTATTNANAKIAEIETRFQQLTASQQQASEVIDARNSSVKAKTFASLDARLEEGEQDIVTLKNEIANPTYLAPETFYGIGSINALSKSALLAKCELAGQVLKNESKYTPSTWVEWTKGSGVVGDSTGLEITATTSTNASLPTNLKSSTKYLLLYNVVSSSLVTSGFYASTLGHKDPFGSLIVPRTVGNQKIVATTLSSIVNNNLYFYVNADSGNKIKIKDIRLFELPAGSQIESDATNMTADQLALKYPYIQGDNWINTQPQELVVTGKNLFDYKATPYSIQPNAIKTVITDGIKIKVTSAGTYKSISYYLRLEPNTQYRLCFTATKITGTLCNISAREEDYSTSGKYISGVDIPASGDYAFNFTTPNNNNLTILRFHGTYTVSETSEWDFTNIMLVKGIATASYEPYTETVVQIPELKAANDNVRDISDAIIGKLTQNVGEVVLKAEDITGFSNTAYTNIDLIYTINPPDSYQVVSSSYTGKGMIPGFTEKTFSDSLDNIGTWFKSSSDNKFKMCVAKGTYADKNAAQAALAGTVIYYKLATPKETYYPTKAIMAVPGGLVYTNPKCTDVGLYSSKITIEQTSYPIKSLKYVNKIDVNIGTLTPIDISSCTVASDGLSFTITGAVAGEFYDYGWYYDNSISTVPAVTITCASDLKAAVDETTKGVKRVSDVVDRVDNEVEALNARMIKPYATKADCTNPVPWVPIIARDIKKMIYWDGVSVWYDMMGNIIP